MRDAWLHLVDTVLRPARPHLARCLAERERHVAEREKAAAIQARAVADCVARIEAARAEVFAADDGVVSQRMTELEREWRRLSKKDPDAGLMDLWALIAPSSWIDRKRWRDAAPPARLDAAIALASDPEGVEGAERAAGELRDVLAPWGVVVGARVRWRPFERDVAIVADLFSAPLVAARDVLAARDGGSIALERAAELERSVNDAALARFGDRTGLARDLAHAAFVDAVWTAARIGASPVAPLRAIWSAGYGLASADDGGVVLELPAGALL